MITHSPDDLKDQNKELVRRFYTTAFVEHDLRRAEELLAPDYLLHDPTLKAGELAGKHAWRKLQSGYFKVVPDHQLFIEDQIAEGDKVVTRWTTRGSLQKDLPGVPAASHKGFVVTGITITRVEDGQIAEEWQDWDSQGFFEQIGAEPDLRQAV